MEKNDIWLLQEDIFFSNFNTVFENHRKSLQKWFILASSWKPEACGQTVLPDRSVFIGQKLVENARIQIRHFEYFSNNVNCKKSVQDEQ